MDNNIIALSTIQEDRDGATRSGIERCFVTLTSMQIVYSVDAFNYDGNLLQ